MVLQRSYGGEDAHFVSDVGGGALGIADGVGGWVRDGINPAGASAGHPCCPVVQQCLTSSAAAKHMNSAAALRLHCSNASGLLHLQGHAAALAACLVENFVASVTCRHITQSCCHQGNHPICSMLSAAPQMLLGKQGADF